MPDFADDPNTQQIAEAYALDAIDFARKNFKLSLDWTDASVAKVESMLDDFDRMPARNKSPEVIMNFAKMLGSYVGETYRKNHGAKWGMVAIDSRSFPGMRADKDGDLFWPWGKVQSRMTNGRQDSVWAYYQILISK